MIGIILGENSLWLLHHPDEVRKATKFVAFVSVWETKNLIWNEHRYCFILYLADFSQRACHIINVPSKT